MSKKMDLQLELLIQGLGKACEVGMKHIPTTKDEVHLFYCELIASMQLKGVITESEWRSLASPPYPVNDKRFTSLVDGFKATLY